jgi:uncharacterized membrane protein
VKAEARKPAAGWHRIRRLASVIQRLAISACALAVGGSFASGFQGKTALAVAWTCLAVCSAIIACTAWIVVVLGERRDGTVD